MAEERTQRRLAAILAADVVGYSRLMEQDEAGTLAALRQRRREILQPLVAAHHGRIVKVMGDGVLVEFGSAVNAVTCAVELQKRMAEANEGTADPRIILRIGINLGDVVVDRGDLYGESVNVSARLEGMAEPGSILVSSSAYDQVKNKITTDFEDLGVQTLKNIAEPVRVYRITGTPRASIAASKVETDKPSIAVLPFVNMSADPEQQYFGDGVTEDIITELSRFHSLLVIARNSSFQYRAAADVKQIAQELRVQYVVEGSVRRSGGRARITAQLIEGETGNHLWAERYDRTIDDIFIVQDEVAQAIAATIEGRMAASGARRSRRKPTNDLAAYDYFLQGRESVEQRGDTDAAARLLRRAIELDPRYAQAYAWLSRVHIHLYHFDLRSETLCEALTLAQQALSLDEADAWCHAALGFAYLLTGQHELAGVHLNRAIALNPMDVRITSQRALWLSYTGRGDEATRSLDADLRRDPFPPSWYWSFLGVALFQARRYEEAIQAHSRPTKLYRWDYYYITAAYAHLGLIDRARTFGAEIRRLHPDFGLEQVALTERFQHQADLDHLLDGLRDAGLSE
jgi:TolB-like protein/Tfp pilus assembly protein PilF